MPRIKGINELTMKVKVNSNIKVKYQTYVHMYVELMPLEMIITSYVCIFKHTAS